jgi:hypothetical protein
VEGVDISELDDPRLDEPALDGTADPAELDTTRRDPPVARPRLVVAASRHGRQFHRSRTFDVFVGVGLVTYGIVHLLIAWIAVRIAWTGGKGNDSQDAALDALAQTVFGETLLWVTAFGLAALTLWQVFETIWRRTPAEARLNRTFGRLGSSFSAIAYVTLAISAGRVAVAGRAAREGRRAVDESTAVEEVILRVFAVAVGVGLIVVAVRSVYRGIRRRFVDDLKDDVNPKIVVLGQAGFVGKGITFAIVGVLMIVTGFDGRTGTPGLQAVLRLLNLSPAGGALLLLKAVGIALFGIYCFAWAANRRR